MLYRSRLCPSPNSPTRLIARLLQPGSVFIDGGASFGHMSMIASVRVGQLGQVHAFEPLPSNADFLRDLARRTTHPNIVVHTRALSDKNETATFQIPVEHMSGSGFITRDGGDFVTGTVEIHCSTLDSMSGVQILDVAIRRTAAFGWSGCANRGSRHVIVTNRSASKV